MCQNNLRATKSPHSFAVSQKIQNLVTLSFSVFSYDVNLEKYCQHPAINITKFSPKEIHLGWTVQWKNQ